MLGTEAAVSCRLHMAADATEGVSEQHHRARGYGLSVLPQDGARDAAGQLGYPDLAGVGGRALGDPHTVGSEVRAVDDHLPGTRGDLARPATRCRVLLERDPLLLGVVDGVDRHGENWAVRGAVPLDVCRDD